MEPRSKHGVKPHSIANVKAGKTSKSTDHSGGRQTHPTHKKGASVKAPLIAPPRLKSRAGGAVVKSDLSKPKVKR